MEINISKETYEARWVEHDGCELLIEPYPMGRNDLIIQSGDSLVISGTQRKKMFMQSLKNWRDLNDSNGDPVPFNNKMKELVFDHGLGGIAGFVYDFNTNFKASLEKESANLHNGQDGDLTQDTKPAQTVEDK